MEDVYARNSVTSTSSARLLDTKAPPPSASSEARRHLGSIDEHAEGPLASPLAETLDSREVGLRTTPVDLGRGATVGRYMILSLLGRGGMGEVYTAYDPELDRRVAIKLLHAARRSEGARIRLVREARALGKLSSPNVVQIYDVGEHEGDVFLAMELVQGQSLEDWCNADPRPSWREVLDAYLDAGRGLRAAHEKGMIHRDVKPANILRGSDGRVRVADFGLAAGRELGGEVVATAVSLPGGVLPQALHDLALGDTLPLPPTSSPSIESSGPLTQAGSIMGTPLYMAPEQLRGAPATPASDQYSLCVSLHEGLYGIAPHERTGVADSETVAQLLERKSEPLPASPPSGGDVPAWLYRALVRGLAPDPADRYPSIEALLVALSDDPDVRSRARRRLGIVGGVGAALLAVAIAGWVRKEAPDDPCKRADRELSGVWDDGVRTKLRQMLVGTGRSYGGATANLVSARLDDYAHAFVTMRGEVCEASRTGVERHDVTALRDTCLDRRRGRLAALTTLLVEKSDTAILDKAVSASEDLPPIAYCSDVAALTAPFPPPEDPAARARVKELEQRLDRVKALQAAGKYADARTLAEPLLADAEQVAYPPLVGEARSLLGRVLERAGEFEKAKELLRAAASASAEGRDLPGVEAAWGRVLFILGERQRHLSEAGAVASFGPTLSAGVSDVGIRAAWLNAEGLFLYRSGKNAEALATHQRALSLLEGRFGEERLAIANALNNIGLAYTAMGDHVHAVDALERGVSVFEKVLGPEHPDVANAVDNLGIAYFDSGDYVRAKAMYERSRAIYERTLGPDSAEGAPPILNLGNILFVTGDFAGARDAYERDRAIEERGGGRDHPNLMMAVGNLAEADLNLGDYAAAESNGLRAIEGRTKLTGADSVDVASAETTVARARIRLGKLRDAETLLVHALAVKEKALDPTSSDLSDVLLGMGELRLAQKRAGDALPLLERAVKIAEPYGKPDMMLTLADALVASHGDRSRARTLATEARAAYDRFGHAAGRARATKFLAEYPAGGGP
jgi:tetratricopeptide (TPR) repeat protein/predicted Ser/Thr protein kinase